MSLYALPPFLSALLFGFLAVFVSTRRKRTVLNSTLALACSVTCWWQSCWFFLFSTENISEAQLLAKVGYTGIIFIPFALYHFFVIYVRSKQDLPFVVASYLVGGGLVLLLWMTDLFVGGVYQYSWGFYPKAGPLHPLFLALLAVLALRALVLLRKEFLNYRPWTRRRRAWPRGGGPGRGR